MLDQVCPHDLVFWSTPPVWRTNHPCEKGNLQFPNDTRAFAPHYARGIYAGILRRKRSNENQGRIFNRPQLPEKNISNALVENRKSKFHQQYQW
jgi:hypothetical protein